VKKINNIFREARSMTSVFVFQLKLIGFHLQFKKKSFLKHGFQHGVLQKINCISNFFSSSVGIAFQIRLLICQPNVIIKTTFTLKLRFINLHKVTVFTFNSIRPGRFELLSKLNCSKCCSFFQSGEKMCSGQILQI